MATGTVLFDPSAGEVTLLDFGEDLLHLGARLVVDDARATGVVAVLGGVRNREAHVVEAALVNEVDDQLELVQALEIGDFGSVTGFDKGLEASADQFGGATAEDGLFAEEVAFGLFAEGGFDDAGAHAADTGGIGEGGFERMARSILGNCNEAGNARTFGENFADAMAGSLGGDHADVNVGRGLDRAEVDAEAVREHQGLASRKVRGDVGLVQRALDVVRNEDHHDVGGLDCVGCLHDCQTGGLDLCAALAVCREAHNHVEPGIAQVQRVRVALAAVADNGDFLALEGGDTAVLLVVTS